MLLKASIGEKRHTKTILRKDWERLGFAQRREVFTHANVHISGPPQEPLFGIQDWSSLGLDGLLDLAQFRQVHDMTVPIVGDENTNLRLATLGDMIKYITNIKKEVKLAPMEGAKSKLGAHCLNALDIPLPGANTPIEFDDCSRFIFQPNGAFKWRTKLGLTSLANHWGLLALQSARSGAHIDAGGGCSIIHMLHGSKEWLIATSASMLPGPCGWRPEDSAWEAVYLRPGDDLLLQPGTVHSDITLDDCLRHRWALLLFGPVRFNTQSNGCRALPREMDYEHRTHSHADASPQGIGRIRRDFLCVYAY
ncbi:hypothetical protein DFH11DRAFT_82020 [Phellopilus nigrolimitatus]|nr:hypothetical protein DFH11DRAFT_82020 [Phellopilus nigrolimitatus]